MASLPRHSFLLIESAARAAYREAPIPRRLWHNSSMRCAKCCIFATNGRNLAGLPLSGQIGLQQLDVQQIDVQQIGLQQNLKQNDRHSQNAGAREVKPLSHSAFGQRRRPASAILAAVAERL